MEAGAMWLPQGRVLTVQVFWGAGSPEVGMRERVLSGLQVAKGVGLAGRAWQSARPVASAGPAPGEGFPDDPAGSMGGVSPAIALPAVDDDDVLAVLVVYAREPLTPGARLMDALAEVGSQLGTFLARRRGVLRPSRLTRRELEVLQLAAQGLSGHEIQSRLLVSGSTVKTHFEHIYLKLGVSNRVAAVATALREGLIE
jgi:DNA-binding CsgD family transcriptional regulator